jgi:hypothetical protein
VVLAGHRHLHRHQLVPLLLEALDDFPHQAPLDAVGLDHNVCAGATSSKKKRKKKEDE